ncbi:MAG: hypothetical protein FWF34_01780 [Alphaproteobacteria bacterium]|nr:hypothetical protein [Alphaproteobacteria bacterium]MCL2889964.1 hypothetical protein [Alphaproteobacteria bacterium]
MKNIEQSYARVFGTTDGKRVIAHLREITIERFLGPDASDSALRTLEGQRALVHKIEALIKRGKHE